MFTLFIRFIYLFLIAIEFSLFKIFELCWTIKSFRNVYFESNWNKRLYRGSVKLMQDKIKDLWWFIILSCLNFLSLMNRKIHILYFKIIFSIIFFGLRLITQAYFHRGRIIILEIEPLLNLNTLRFNHRLVIGALI